MNLPESFTARMENILGSEFKPFLDSYNLKPAKGMRVNTLKVTKEELIAKLGLNFENVKWCENGLYCDDNFHASKNPFYNAGLYYIQEPSAMSSAAFLDVSPGDKVLDLCAAPGGKSSQLAAKLNGTGLLVANDSSASRCLPLAKNLELMGVTNYAVTTEYPKRLADVFPNFFDAILVDAPCSGEGMFRKDINSVQAWSVYKNEACSSLQKEILYYAEKMLKPTGKIMYSTCTFDPAEDEEMILGFITKHPEFKINSIGNEKYNFSNGLNIGNSKLLNCARLYPHKIKGEGHFLAYMQRNEDAVIGNEVSYPPQPNPKELIYFHEFCNNYLNKEIPNCFAINGTALYSISPLLPSMKGIRLTRSGLYLGELKTKRFEPSQAFAMSLKHCEFKNVLNLSIDDEKVMRYLKGECFECDCSEGYVLVCIENYPLGFGKVVNGRLKNKYPHGWVIC